MEGGVTCRNIEDLVAQLGCKQQRAVHEIRGLRLETTASSIEARKCQHKWRSTWTAAFERVNAG